MAHRKGQKPVRPAGAAAPLNGEPVPKPVYWMGSAKKDLSRMARDIRYVFGHAIFLAQVGETHPDAKSMKGFGGAAKVTEVIADYETDTYRAMYTVKLGDYVFVLHCFKKKSTSGTKTPRADIDVIEQRLKDATMLYAQLKQESR